MSSMSDNVHCDYDGDTIEEMREHRNNPNLDVIDDDELDKLFDKYFYDINHSEFTEIDKERYDDLYNCLPPARNMDNMFFVGEPYSGRIYPFCFTIGNRYFFGHRNVYMSAEELRAQIEEHWEKVKDKA